MFYIVDTLKKSFEQKGKYSAMAKPRKDFLKNCDSFLDSKVILIRSFVKQEHCSKILRLLNNVRMFIIGIVKTSSIKNSDVFLQYPFTDGVLMILARFLKRNNKIHVLIHDIESIRQNRVCKKDKEIFGIADTLILHSKPMAEECVKLGFKGQVHILEFFDYNIDGIIPVRKKENNSVVFAGNLTKSKFINELYKIENTIFYLYGKGYKNVGSKNIQYKGYFEANSISSIQGDWGLVWDGDSVETCAGDMGNYLKYNAPFKMSLYLAANIPVIVWKYSAMAKYVKEYNLGIVVESLFDIDAELKKLSLVDFNKILCSVSKFSEEIRHGDKTKKVLKQILK